MDIGKVEEFCIGGSFVERRDFGVCNEHWAGEGEEGGFVLAGHVLKKGRQD